MSDYSSSEIKSGALITFSLILLFGLTFVVGRFMTGSTQSYKIRFGYISGLEEDAPVYYAGHEVGKVDRIEVVSGEARPILLTISMQSHITPRQDSDAFVDTLGMMGEKFVEITAGSPELPAVSPTSVIEGTDPIPMYLLIQKMNLLADRMDEMTTSLNPMVERIDDLLAGNKEEISKMIANFHETSANVRDMTHDLKYRPWRLVRKS